MKGFLIIPDPSSRGGGGGRSGEVGGSEGELADGGGGSGENGAAVAAAPPPRGELTPAPPASSKPGAGRPATLPLQVENEIRVKGLKI